MKLLFCLSALIWAAIAPLALADSAAWSATPTSSDWNTAANWTPATIPDGPDDIATFGVSNTTKVSIATSTTVDAIVFAANADAFTITASASLIISGGGVTNNSESSQSFTTTPGPNSSRAGLIEFTGTASIMGPTLITNNGSITNQGRAGTTFFLGNASAAGAGIVNNPGNGSIAEAGTTYFEDNSTAATAVISNFGNFPAAGFAAQTIFQGASTADHATFVNEGTGSGPSGATLFYDNSTAANAVFTNNNNGLTQFDGEGVSAGNAMIINNGATQAGSTIHGGRTIFYYGSDAGEATLIANGGSNGGVGGFIGFLQATAPNATFQLHGNGTLSPPPVIGSLEGDGVVSFGGGGGSFNNKHVAVGNSNQDTTFAGTFEEFADSGLKGSVEKVGSGKLVLTGSSTYKAGTTVTSGTLVVDNPAGSATGFGAVNVNGGTLGGTGNIAGAVTVGAGSGAGAILQPSVGLSQTVTLTIQSLLTFKADGTYTCKLSTQKRKADQVVASGVTIETGAQFNFTALARKRLATGTVFTVISNTSATPISGTFANLPDGSTLTAGRRTLVVSYTGGDGNDLTLTVQ